MNINVVLYLFQCVYIFTHYLFDMYTCAIYVCIQYDPGPRLPTPQPPPPWYGRKICVLQHSGTKTFCSAFCMVAGLLSASLQIRGIPATNLPKPCYWQDLRSPSSRTEAFAMFRLRPRGRFYVKLSYTSQSSITLSSVNGLLYILCSPSGIYLYLVSVLLFLTLSYLI